MFDADGWFLVGISQEGYQGLNSFIIYKIALIFKRNFHFEKKLILKVFEIKVI